MASPNPSEGGAWLNTRPAYLKSLIGNIRLAGAVNQQVPLGDLGGFSSLFFKTAGVYLQNIHPSC